ncbi:DUF1573 domain-containing protein [Tenacibaculum dicentrarchi]|uniref:DUF1573 domain-containing protein n=1 Tax=Tenacibaculum dicentrarchi TaxID=669041 RepID=A0ABP1EP01_9FLAO|nr:conserved exported hypothetical protein [Tenacibaculum dicentrarchi]SOU85836.1 conserved exported hypothetical protein [Tenacibaculum dicentrarchi]
MKTILTLSTVFLMALSVNAQEFKFVAESIDYGKITQGSEKNRVFEFTNIGNVPLIIQQVVSTCGCAVPKKPENPIMPGEKGKIAVSYDTNRIGGFSKMFTIISNAKTTSKRIKIKGHVTAKNTLASK